MENKMRANMTVLGLLLALLLALPGALAVRGQGAGPAGGAQRVTRGAGLAALAAWPEAGALHGWRAADGAAVTIDPTTGRSRALRAAPRWPGGG